MERFADVAEDAAGDYVMLGHLGEDYGSECEVCGYNTKHNFSLSVLMTSSYGMNCSSQHALAAGAGARNDIANAIYQAVVGHLTNGSAATLSRSQMMMQKGIEKDGEVLVPEYAVEYQEVADAGMPDGYSCKGKEDIAVPWIPNGECTYNSRMRTYYKIKKVTEAGYELQQFVFKNCFGLPITSKISLDVCAPKYSSYDFPQTSLYTMSNASGELAIEQRIWLAGAVTGCE